MPIRIQIYAALQLGACLYAIFRGGAPERWTAWMMAGAAAVTSVLPFETTTTFVVLDRSQLLIDLALLIGLTVLACRADRYWPLWIAALQTIAIGAHLVRAVDPTILPIIYNRSIGKLAYPMIALLVVGTYRYQRRKLGGEPQTDWSPLRWH